MHGIGVQCVSPSLGLYELTQLSLLDTQVSTHYVVYMAGFLVLAAHRPHKFWCPLFILPPKQGSSKKLLQLLDILSLGYSLESLYGKAGPGSISNKAHNSS